MENPTTINYINGTWYLRVPPAFAKHIGLEEKDKNRLVDGKIQDETNKKGQHYCSFWKTKK